MSSNASFNAILKVAKGGRQRANINKLAYNGKCDEKGCKNNILCFR